MTFSTDHNTKTVLRAINAAQDYVNRGMATQAKRDVDRAKSYLPKCPSDDVSQLEADIQTLEATVVQAEQKEETKRLMVQLKRQIRYAQEAVQKNNVNDIQRYIASARREISKLPDSDIQNEQQAAVDNLEAQGALAEEQARCASTLRQLEREFRSVKDTVKRSGGTMSLEGLEPYFGKVRTTMEKLPESLQKEWEDKIDDVVAEATGIIAKREHEKAATTAYKNKTSTTRGTSAPNSPGATSVSTTSTASNSTIDATASLDPNLKRMVDRYIGSVKSSLERSDLGRANADTEKCREIVVCRVPTESQAGLLAEIEALQGEIDATFHQMKVDQLLDLCRRAFEDCHCKLDDTRWHGSDIADKIEYRLEQLDLVMKKDGNVLSDEESARIQTRYSELRAGAKKAVGNYYAKEARKMIERYDEELTSGDISWVESRQRSAKEALDRVSTEHNGFNELKRLQDTLDQRYTAICADEEKQRILDEVNRAFDDMQCYGNHIGYEDEGGSSYDHWRATFGALGLDKTINACEVATEFLECDQVKAVMKAGFKDVISEKMASTTKMRAESLNKVNKTVLSIVDQADEKDRPDNLVSVLESMMESLEKIRDPDQRLKETLAAVKTKVASVNYNMNEKAAILDSKLKKATETAVKLWADIVATSDAVDDFDPYEILEDPKEWKGKITVLEGTHNRLGWEYDTGGCDFIANVDGVPVMATFDPKVKDALETMEKTIGAERKSQEFEGLVMKVRGKGKAQPIRRRQIDGKLDYLTPEDAVRMQIVAFRSGAFAVAADGTRSIYA